MRDRTIKEFLDEYSFVVDFFSDYNIDVNKHLDKTIDELFSSYDDDEKENIGVNLKEFKSLLNAYIETVENFLISNQRQVKSIKIIAGQDKQGNKETFGEIEIKPSDIVAIVGPTGSGKSRLLADIEWAANKDTPTKRQILINGKVAEKSWRYSANNKLVAQLSQNMNFVIDLTVEEFLDLHAQSRMVENRENVVKEIIECANTLAGEQFSSTTNITSLSGGQSRALMIADTAILTNSPIILIDEIENAGIDRKKALDLLVSNDKIVLIATHDPMLALNAKRRIVIKNGAISKIIETTEEEKGRLIELEKAEQIISAVRTNLRLGNIIE